MSILTHTRLNYEWHWSELGTILVIYGIYGLYSLRSKPNATARSIPYWGLIGVGVCSAAYHMTLKYHTQMCMTSLTFFYFSFNPISYLLYKSGSNREKMLNRTKTLNHDIKRMSSPCIWPQHHWSIELWPSGRVSVTLGPPALSFRLFLS